MTRQQYRSVLDDILEVVDERLLVWGTDVIVETFTTILNLTMTAERETVMVAASFERSTERKGYTNGFNPKTLATRVGESLPAACGDWAATKAGYRLLDHPNVDESAILTGHFHST